MFGNLGQSRKRSRAEEALDEETPQVVWSPEAATVRDKLVDMSVVAETRANYEGSIATMKKWLEQRGESEMTLPLFTILLMNKALTTRDSKAAGSLRSAARWHVQHGGWPAMSNAFNNPFSAEGALMKQMCRGVNYAGRARCVPPGSIDRKHFTQLIAFTRKSHDVSQRHLKVRAFYAIFCCALRKSEFFRLQKGDLTRGESPSLLLRTDKRWHAGGPITQPLHRRPVIINDCLTHIEAAELIKVEGEILFPRAEAGYDELTRIIKAAAVEYRWDTKLRWSLHGLRHGGAQEIVKACGGVFGGLAEAATTMSGSTLRNYALPNEERLRRIKAKDFSFTDDYASDEAD
jgi:hypothetical protein